MMLLQKIFFAVLLPAYLVSCRNREQNSRPATILHRDRAVPGNFVPTVSIVNDTLIRMQFTRADTGTIASVQVVLAPGRAIHCLVAVAGTDSLLAVVLPESGHTQVRFTRLLLPDGNTSGPFGAQLRNASPQTGTYQLVIGANRTAAENRPEKIRIRVWVKQKIGNNNSSPVSAPVRLFSQPLTGEAQQIR